MRQNAVTLRASRRIPEWRLDGFERGPPSPHCSDVAALNPIEPSLMF